MRLAGLPTSPSLPTLPPEARRPVTREFLRHWLRDRDYVDVYRRWALDLEESLDLRSWARGTGGRPQALRVLVKDRWQGFLNQLRDLKNDEDALLAYLRVQRALTVADDQCHAWRASRLAGAPDGSGPGPTEPLRSRL